MNKKKLTINANFQWEIDQREWSELKLHQKTIENDIQNKFEYDPTFVFHVLNDISDPKFIGLKLNGVTKKVKL